MTLDALIDTVDAAGSRVWQTSLEASVLIFLVWLIQGVLGKFLRPRWRYALSLLVLLRLVMPAVPPSSFSAFNLAKNLWLPRLAIADEARNPSGGEEAEPSMRSHAPQIPEPRAGTARSSRRTASSGLEAGRRAREWEPVMQTGAGAIWMAGLAGMIGAAGWRHRRFSRSVQQARAVVDPRVLALLDGARALLGLRRPISVVALTGLPTPAVFGVWKPRLVLPSGLTDQLRDEELRLIFLHELTHVRRGDVWLNWVVIFVRALHWYNPLVWLAFRRLRADQELACDAAVLERLAPGERRGYGETLIKLAETISECRLSPSLVPVITKKHEIKRRIIMITQFKPTGWLALIASVLLLVALCGLTFTRAAESAEPPAAAPRPLAARQGKQAERERAAQEHFKALKAALDRISLQVAAREKEVRNLQDQLNISNSMADADTWPGTLNRESLSRLDEARIQSIAQLAKYETLLAKLKNMPPDQLRKSISTAFPGETELTELITKRDAAEQERASLLKDKSLAHPEGQRIAGVLKEINHQIDDKIDGVLGGLDAVVASNRAQVETLTRQLDEAKTKDEELAAKYRPYYEAKRRLAFEQKKYEALVLRIVQERVDLALPPREAQR